MAMDRVTGEEIAGIAEIEQSVSEILGTIPGDRYMRADYGSELFALTDIGMNASARARFALATGDALRRFEPRVRVDRVTIDGSAGEVVITAYCTMVQTGQQIVVRR